MKRRDNTGVISEDSRLVGTVPKVVEIGAFRPNPWNPTGITSEERDRIRHGFKTDGWLVAQALLVWRTDEKGARRDLIVDGEQRWTVATEIGIERGPVSFLDGIAEAAARRLTVKLNARRAGGGRFDPEKFKVNLTEIGRFDPAPLNGMDLGFDDASFMRLSGIRPTVADDDVEEPADGPFDSVAGGAYELGRHLLVCGDSTDAAVVSRALAGVEPRIMFVDPPFDLSYSAWFLPESVDVAPVWYRNKDGLLWMARAFSGDEWGMHTLVFSGGVRGQHNHTLPACMHENVTIWRRKWWRDKFDAIDRRAIEESGCRATKDGRPISWQEHVGGVLTGYGGMSWGKPTVEFEIPLAYVPRGSVAWDPCASSGSSLIACEKHGRPWRGVELLPKWCDLIRRRWTKWARARGIDPGPGLLE